MFIRYLHTVHISTEHLSQFISVSTFFSISWLYLSRSFQGVPGSSGTPRRPGNGSGSGWRKSKKILYLKQNPNITTKYHLYYLYACWSNVFTVIQALLPLASESTDVGKIKAGQALAKIAITSNPEIAFPGERVRQSCFILTQDLLSFFSYLCGF